MRVEPNTSALGLNHRDVGHREGGEDDWVLVKVGRGDQSMQRRLRVRHHRGGVSKHDVLNR